MVGLQRLKSFPPCVSCQAKGPTLTIFLDRKLLVHRSPRVVRPLRVPIAPSEATPTRPLPRIDSREARDPRSVIFLPNQTHLSAHHRDKGGEQSIAVVLCGCEGLGFPSIAAITELPCVGESSSLHSYKPGVRMGSWMIDASDGIHGVGPVCGHSNMAANSPGLPRQEGVYATLNDVPWNWAKVPGIEGTAVGVRHQQEFRWSKHMIGDTKPW